MPSKKKPVALDIDTIDMYKHRLEIVNAFIKAVKNRKKVFSQIKKSDSRADAQDRIAKVLKLPPMVAAAVLELRTYQFSPANLNTFKEERDEIIARLKND